MKLDAKGVKGDGDKDLTKWSLSSFNTEGKIEVLYDKNRKKKVLKLQGNGTKSSYIYRFNHKLENSKVLSWSMKYAEDYVIMIVLNTLQGKRSLIYIPSTTQAHLQFGLGEGSISNEWKEYYRDLDSDLQRYEPENHIVTLEYFVVRGSGLIETPKIVKVKKSVPLKHVDRIAQPLKSKKSSLDKLALPLIKILGDNPLILKRGQKYAEQGVVAKDIDGSLLTVDISHNIDSYQDGEYSVIYMSTNSLGNTAVDRRIVRVGNITKSIKNAENENQELKEEEEDKIQEEEEADSPQRIAIEEFLPSDKRVNQEREESLEAFPERPGL
jgi:hypothetical protein